MCLLKKKFTIIQHVSRDKHLQGLRRQGVKPEQ